MTRKSRIAQRLLSLVAVALCACSTYMSPGLDGSDAQRVATLSAPTGILGTGTVRLTEVDGMPVGADRITTAILAPGKRLLRVDLELGNAKPAPRYLSFEARAGVRYALTHEITETSRSGFGPQRSASGTWNAWGVEELSGTKVSRPSTRTGG
jgi:hypothetical protein